MKLKNNINLWTITYKEEELNLATVFNSGFINDIDIVRNYFILNNPVASEITIKHVSDESNDTVCTCNGSLKVTHGYPTNGTDCLKARNL